MKGLMIDKMRIVCAIKPLPEDEIGHSDVPMSVVVDGMQLLHSYFDSSL